MKQKLLFLNLLFSTSIFAQFSQSFEDVTGANCGNSTCQYIDSDTSTHTLQNMGGIIVTEQSSPNKLGYTVDFTSTGGVGFSDGDIFGVYGNASINNEVGVNAIDGTQAFVMEDTDGTVDLTFSNLDLTSTTNPMVSLNYIVASTTWETADFINIRIEITDCASATTLTLLNVNGSDIEGGAITEGAWNALSQDLTAYIGCKAQLIIGFASNAATEEFAIDNINFSGGVTLTNSDFTLGDEITIYPNPVSGNTVQIQSSSNSVKNVSVYNLLGKMVKNENLTIDRLNIEDLQPGTYLVKISQDNMAITKRLIVK